MNFSDLFQRIKHENHQVTAKERDQITQFLKDSDSIFKAEAHAAIYVLCLSSEPTPENVTLVERFLSEQTIDYARAGAISCLFTIWNLAEERHVAYVLDALGRVLDEERDVSSTAAIGSALHMMHTGGRHDLSLALSHALDDLYHATLQEDEFAVNLFITACLHVTNARARRMERRPTYFHTIDEALHVYLDKGAYLLSPPLH